MIEITFVAKARAAHGIHVSDWIIALAELADRVGLKGCHARIGYARTTISQVLSATYAGRLDLVESRVRDALTSETVNCPALGELNRATCTNWQSKAFATSSSLRVRMYRSCRSGCPHSRHTREVGDVE